MFHHHLYRFQAFDSAGRFLPIEQRRLCLICQTAPDDPILSVTAAVKINSAASLAYVLTTSRGVRLLGGDGSTIALLPWAPRRASNSSVNVSIAPNIDKSTPNPDHYFFWFWSTDVRKPGTAVVTEVSGRGQILQQVSMTRAAVRMRPSSVWYGLGAPLTTAPFFAADVSMGDQSVGVKFVAISFAAALICAVLAWRVGARCGADRRVQRIWAVACLLLGAPALMTILALRAWPSRVRCPWCSQLRTVMHERCEHCGAPFPPPPVDGTEIFENSNPAIRAV